MNISRRDLLRTTGAVGGAAALGGFGGLAAEAVTGVVANQPATLGSVLLRAKPGANGWRKVVRRDGERHQVRTNLGVDAESGRKKRRKPLLAFVQLSDVHVLDAQSPLRFEGQDVSVSSSAYRPQEVLTAQVAEAMVREINAVASGPVTGKPLAFALQTGDNSDNSQYNEIRWNIDVLDGGEIVPDSGDLTKYEGVMDETPENYSPMFYHPGGTPAGKGKDDYRKAGFPVLPTLLDDCRAPFDATGLTIPWYVALGNHDELTQGNFPHNDAQNATATGNQKLQPTGVRTVTADPDRRLLSRTETVTEHFTTTGLPVGHGFTQGNVDAGTAYYTFDQGLLRFIVLDSVSAATDKGNIDAVQLQWLKDQLDDSAGFLVVVSSHHPSWTFGTPAVADEVVETLLAHKNVIAWVNGHTHRNVIKPHKRTGGKGGFWEINTAAHIDWPQQSRLIEVTDNKDGTLSIFCTMLDHGAPLNKTATGSVMKLAGLSRQLAANDIQEQDDDRRGKLGARNVELLVKAPAFL